MYVKDMMIENPITIGKDTKITAALDLMLGNNIHRLPVVDKAGNLIGIITESLIKDGASTRATSLSIYELNYLLSKTEVEEVMIKKVITIDKGAFVEEAARIMRENNIGCLPVVEEGKVIGIITTNDILDALMNLLGYRSNGSKYIIRIEEDRVGLLEAISSTFHKENVSISNMSIFYGKEDIDVIVIAHNENYDDMKSALEKEGFNVSYAGLHRPLD